MTKIIVFYDLFFLVFELQHIKMIRFFIVGKLKRDESFFMNQFADKKPKVQEARNMRAIKREAKYF